MAYITSFTYCDSIQTELTPQGVRHQVINPLQILTPISVPGNYSFAIACNVADFNPNTENTVRILFVSENNVVINDTQDIRFQVPVEHIDSNPNKPAMMQFNLDFRNLVLPVVGVYTTKVYVNQELVGEYKIPVVVGA